MTLAVVLAVRRPGGRRPARGPEVGGLVLAYGVGTTLYSYVLKTR